METGRVETQGRTPLLHVVVLLVLCMVGLGCQRDATPDLPIEDVGVVAPGWWAFVPDEMVSGRKTRMELHYYGERDLPAGTRHQILLEPFSVQSLFHCPPSEHFELHPIEGFPFPEIQFKPGEQDSRGFRPLDFIFPEGLKADDAFAVVFGNKGKDGEIIGIVNPFPATRLACATYTYWPRNDGEAPKRLNWQRKGWGDKLSRLDIVPAPASGARLFLPSLVAVGRRFRLRISIVDPFDSPANPVFGAAVSLEGDSGIQNLPARLTFSEKDKCFQTVENLVVDKPGVYRVRASLPDIDETFESNPVVVREEVEVPVHWGNIHNHGWYSEGWGDNLDTFYAQARDYSGMDYVSLSDHRGQMPVEGGHIGRILRWRLNRPVGRMDAWVDTIQTANKYNGPDFVTWIGYEWSSMNAGHNNVYFTDDDPAHAARFFTPQYVDLAFPLRNLLRKTDALFIPHIHAELFPYLTVDDQMQGTAGTMTPVIEVYSDWGNGFFPLGERDPDSRFGGLRSVQDKNRCYLWALEQGFRLGAIGDSDCHGGLPGRRVVGGIAPAHDHPQGLTAASTANFTREGLMQAYRDRHVYGTTGARIFLEVRAEDARMGDTLETDHRCIIKAEIAGTDVIQSVRLYNGLTLLEDKTLDGKRQGTVQFKAIKPTDALRPYVVAVIQEDENIAFGTPIWIRRASLPELAWEHEPDGRLYLTNNGTVSAKNVTLAHSESEHPFAVGDIPGRMPPAGEEAGIFHTKRRSDQRLVAHFRWLGAELVGTAGVLGAKSFLREDSRVTIFEGEMGERSDGSVNFLLRSKNLYRPSGFSFLIDLQPDHPCTFILTFDKPTRMILGEKSTVGSRFEIPLSGRTSDVPLQVEELSVLEPGQKFFPSAAQQNLWWAADPRNTITETDETNNLSRPPESGIVAVEKP